MPSGPSTLGLYLGSSHPSIPNQYLWSLAPPWSIPHPGGGIFPFSASQGARVLLEVQKEDRIRLLKATEGSLALAVEREATTAETLRKTLEELSIKAQENELMQERCVTI